MSAAATLAPARRHEAPERRHLQVVTGPEATGRAARRVTGLQVACASVGGVLVLLFVLAVMHTAITQGQAHLDDLSAQTSARQAEAQQLRFEVAQLESPARILDEARSRLGMVEPPVVTHLEPVDPAQPLELEPTTPTPAAEDGSSAGIPPAGAASGEGSGDASATTAEVP